MNGISVIIPTYNRVKLLKKSIDSVLKQSFTAIEIIVVDDYSSDDTMKLQNEYDYNIVKFIRNERKKGANGARNTGIMHAKGSVIAFQDSDDLWIESKLKQQYDYLTKNELDLCFCNIKRIFGDSEEIIPNRRISSNEINNLLIQENFISTQTIMLTTIKAKELLFDEELRRFQDWDFVLRASDQNLKIGHVNEALVLVQVQEDSITNSQNLFTAYEDLYKKHPKLLTDKNRNKMVINKIRFYLSLRDKKYISSSYYFINFFYYRSIEKYIAKKGLS